MLKKYTILLIPEGTNKVKRLSIPKVAAYLVVLLVAASMGLAGFWFHQYHGLRCDLPNLQALQQRNESQQAQIKAFERRLASLGQQMDQLKDFNRKLRVMASMDKPPSEEAFLGVGGPEQAAGGPGVRLTTNARDRHLLTMRQRLDRLSEESEIQAEIQRGLAEFLEERRSVLACTPSIWPVRGWVTSGFGYRLSPFTGKRRFHAGIDISTRTGTVIKAPADGVVTFAGTRGGFGKLIVINHGNGKVTRYGHLHKFKAKVGQKVRRGDEIATVGNTGRSTGPHLHYEILVSGVPTNPMFFILD